MTKSVDAFILAEFIIAILSEFFTIAVFISLLYTSFRCKTSRYSVSLQVFAFIEVILSMSVIVYFGYLVTIWRHPQANSYLLYFTGAAQTSLFIISSLAVCVLGIDRCLAVKVPTRSFNTTCFCGFILVNVVFMAINFIERLFPAYPSTTMTHCQYFGCLLTDYQNIVYYVLRACASLVNFIVGTVLTVFLKRMTVVHSQLLKSSKKIIATCFITVTFDLLPHLLSVVSYQIFSFNLSSYIGPYSTVIGAIESAICAFFYLNTFKCCNKLVENSTSNLPRHNVALNAVNIVHTDS